MPTIVKFLFNTLSSLLSSGSLTQVRAWGFLNASSSAVQKYLSVQWSPVFSLAGRRLTLARLRLEKACCCRCFCDEQWHEKSPVPKSSMTLRRFKSLYSSPLRIHNDSETAYTGSLTRNLFCNVSKAWNALGWVSRLASSYSVYRVGETDSVRILSLSRSAWGF